MEPRHAITQLSPDVYWMEYHHGPLLTPSDPADVTVMGRSERGGHPLLMACTHTHRHEALRRLDPGPGGELSRRWVRNIMLNKWLEYCADQGHRFAEHRPALHAIVNT